ncbi:MAG: efflux RND transporter periplasmic adaptor subunit [Desulfarculales bacterium]|jgi:macrolide-specific efflux system membrane fusion protein|nr:efflux RND transporter periplasmic adaptor subunit [Desulfarculales bacterium]
MNRKTVKVFSILALALIAVCLLAYTMFSEDDKVTYLTERAGRGDIIQTVSATGDVAARQLVSVGAQVSGQIKKLHVQLGQLVERGGLVAEIDSTTQLNELNINKARLGTYQAQRLSRQIALKVARKQHERELELFKQNATSHENLENAENTMAAAKAALDEINSLIKQTEIAVSTAEVNLSYTRISAPLAGTVVAVHVEEGQTVNANQTTPTIVQIADLSQMEIKLQISEGDVTKVEPGMKVSYSILGEPNVFYETVLQSVDPGLTTLSDQKYGVASSSGSSAESAVYYYGNLIVSNQEGKLRIGMTVQSTIMIAEVSGVVILPTVALQQEAGVTFVNLLDDKSYQTVRREVETGLSDNLNSEIKSGLQEGDTVVSAQMADGEALGYMPGRFRRGAF